MEILAHDSNERGDLFGRLVADLFAAQGYENPRMNIHKTGREIDLKARHGLEPKQAVAECKATKEPVGGDELNKFAGALQAEAHAGKDVQTQGYYVSLNGYRESAREQEEELGQGRFILLDGADVQHQLVKGKMVVPKRHAIEVSGRLANADGELHLAGEPELLAHQIGWIWLCVYERDHEEQRFALVHADGRPLAATLAREVVAADRPNGGRLESLEYCPPETAPDPAAVEAAEHRYREYLLSELGQITLEGLPADEEVGSRRIALEDLYVPLAVEPLGESEGVAESSNRRGSLPEDEVDPLFLDSDENGEIEDREEDESNRESIGRVIDRYRRIAVLADPGSGKSTLIKRLAVAYASDEHRDRVDDDLPDADWLPIFLRCRALGASVREPVHKMLEALPQRGEFPELEDGFRALLARVLATGRAVLLIDGLDEIADEGDRLSFVLQLRTFLATYPNIRVLLTSRERGFRVVAGAMSSICEKYRLAGFDDEDIEGLTRAWHATVVGRSREVDREARSLARSIIDNDRVRRLARNPLLLTTLLLVKRWVGDLPPKRTILYEKAIEVLLMTWNVEAHEPLDLEEAVPQLAFVAHDLTKRGAQEVSSTELTGLLAQAREEMPEILGFARMSVADFVERIESRSSLLVMTGHVVERGKLVPNYEFRHLTFQEYLTAVALVEGFYSGHTEDDQLADMLTEHQLSPSWSEVIALALVRAGRSAGETVRKVLSETRCSLEPLELGEIDRGDSRPQALLLGRALADEVQLPPQLVEEVSAELCRIRATSNLSLVRGILNSRYGEVFRETCESQFLDGDGQALIETGRRFVDLVVAETGSLRIGNARDRDQVLNLLNSTEVRVQARGAMLATRGAFGAARADAPEPETELVKALHPWSARLIEICRDGSKPIRYLSTWAMAWLGQLEAVAPADRSPALETLLRTWRTSDSPDLQRQAAWAFSEAAPVSRGVGPFHRGDVHLIPFVEDQAAAEPGIPRREDRRPAALLLAYYLGAPWSDEEIIERAREIYVTRRNPKRGFGTVGRLLPEITDTPYEDEDEDELFPY